MLFLCIQRRPPLHPLSCYRHQACSPVSGLGLDEVVVAPIPAWFLRRCFTCEPTYALVVRCVNEAMPQPIRPASRISCSRTQDNRILHAAFSWESGVTACLCDRREPPWNSCGQLLLIVRRVRTGFFLH